MGIISGKEIKRKEREGRYNLRSKYSDYKWLKAPSNFSLINNAEESIKFIDKINSYYEKRKKVFINLEFVESIGHGAIVVLLSKMVQFKANNVLFNGNFPKNEKARKVLDKSGFFDNLFKEFNVQDTYDLSPISNSIYTHAQKNVNSELSETIIQKASTSIWKKERRCPGLQRVFLELMQNTNNHASFNTSGEKHWWMSINYKKEENKVCFSFLDFGVGIFESLANKKHGNKFYGAINKIKELFSPENNSDVLRLLLSGEVHKTVTGHYYRGKGLPGVFNANKKNAICNLRIISNDAYADPSNNDYRKLNNGLTGTFIYWELNENCINIENDTN